MSVLLGKGTLEVSCNWRIESLYWIQYGFYSRSTAGIGSQAVLVRSWVEFSKEDSPTSFSTGENFYYPTAKSESGLSQPHRDGAPHWSAKHAKLRHRACGLPLPRL